MRKRRHYAKPSTISVVISLSVALVIFLCGLNIICFFAGNIKGTHNEEEIMTETPAEKNKNSISIPGYEMLELKANSAEQSICLGNPSQNNCWFKVSLWLEGGDCLWESEFIGPGEYSKPIILVREIKKGVYPNSMLRYECFCMDEDRSPLNGAETKLTIRVK